MGNVLLSERDEEDSRDALSRYETSDSDPYRSDDDENRCLTDLSQLFGSSETLRSAATKIKELVQENVILQNHSHIQSWLESRTEMSEDTVTLAQFCDMLSSHGVERVDAIRAFHQFDNDGSGVAEVENMSIALEHYMNQSLLGDLGKSIRILQSCSLNPGFVDMYANKVVDKHGTRMLKYLMWNRVDSKTMPFSPLAGFHNMYAMRSSVLKSSLNSQSLPDKDQDVDLEGEEFEKKTMEDCLTSIKVSSNNNDSQNLLKPNQHWQSDGPARSHWIRLHVKPHVVLKHLSIGVSTSDLSYMPELVTVSVGSSHTRLSEIKEVKISSSVNGDVVLLKGLKIHYPIIQLNIKRCHSDGCDARIHGIKISGYRVLKESNGITTIDASALWCLQMLTSSVYATLPQTPALKDILLGHTKKALEAMPPLSLSASSPDRPSFLNKHVLQEMEAFVTNLSEHGKSSEDGLQIRLAMNLARGNVAGMLKLITAFIDIPDLNLPCVDLLSKALAARFPCWDKISVPLTVKCEGSDGGAGQPNKGPEIVLEPLPGTGSRDGMSSSSRVYLTDEGKTSCTMLFKADDNVQLSRVRIQFAPGKSESRNVLVFVYNPECVEGLTEKSTFDDHIKHFTKYDFWGEMEYKFSLDFRNSGLGGLPDNPVALVNFVADWDELDIPISWSAMGKYVMVKFLEPETSLINRLGIVSIKLFGQTRPLPWTREIEKTVVINNSPKNTECSLPEIVRAVLTFISDIGIDQVRRRQRSILKQFDFLDVSEIDVMVLWNLHLVCADRHNEAIKEGKPRKEIDQWQQSSMMALNLILGLLPVLASTKVASQTKRDSLFQDLCIFINTKGKGESGDTTPKIMDSVTQSKMSFIKEIIIEGAPLFFPEKSKKRDELFKLLDHNSDKSSQPSTALVFQSLCQFFGSVDPKGLLELPPEPGKDFCPSNALGMMKSLLQVSCQEKSVFTEIDANTTATDSTTKTNTSDKLAVKVEVPGKSESDSGGDKGNAAGEVGDGNDVLVLPKSSESEASNEDSSLVAEAGSVTSNTSSKKSESDKTESSGQKMSSLLKLTASLQGSLMTWCWQQLSHLDAQKDEELINTINKIVTEYTHEVMENGLKSTEPLKKMNEEEFKEKVNKHEPQFLYHIVRQQCLYLSVLINKLNTISRVKVLESCKKVMTQFAFLVKQHPSYFNHKKEEKKEKKEKKEGETEEEAVLRVWEIESPHDYPNHANVKKVFHCPGATKFVIDFDSRCETERRYDYLEFVDAKGLKMRFDSKVGTAEWPLQVKFCGPHVSFHFQSDSSNTEWGYKFTVSAKGSPDTPISWTMDLHLGLVKVLGQVCGAVLGSNPITTQELLNSGKDKKGEEQDILHSDLWTSLFRGGYRIEGGGKQLQRSLSGRFATGDDSEIHNFLLEVINYSIAVKREDSLRPKSESDPDEKLKTQVDRLLTKCREADPSKAQLKIGGSAVNKALRSLFAALVWHCQQLREDVSKFLQADESGEISEGIIKAYNFAESTRLKLASERQAWNAKDDKEEDLDPTHLLVAKCLFLLKFAGLTKVQLKNESRTKYSKQMMLKKPGNKAVVRDAVLDKFPSFRLVLEFIQDPAWTCKGVDKLLQERTEIASAIKDVYMFGAEAVRILSNGNPFQLSVVLFLQELFGHQNRFPQHYADGLDGCGLQQESQVRQAYYTLVRFLVDAFNKRLSLDKSSLSPGTYEMIQCFLLHLVDIAWQPYDMSFVSDLGLPQMYLNIAKETVMMRDLIECEGSEEEEMKEYDQTMLWYSEVNEGLDDWFKQKTKQAKDDKKAVRMFVARFSDVLDVEITCNGCHVTLPGRRYRCLQCIDMDLCTACFSGGVEPADHRDDHEIVHLIYKCNHCQAFIVGKRIHCNKCEDFDLCLGCHNKGKFPSCHNRDHDVTTLPMVKLKTSQASTSPLRTYIHQHAWMLYTSLTLTLSDLVYGENNPSSMLDPDYLRIAGQLQSQCIGLATQFLRQNVDVEKGEDLTVEKRMEESFARHSQERIMGLLGAVMPTQEKRSPMSGSGFNFWTPGFLELLFSVAKGDQNHEMNTQHQAIRLIGRLLLCTDIPGTTPSPLPVTPSPTPPLTDAASHPLSNAGDKPPISTTAIQDQQFLVGKETIAQLFQRGAKEFERPRLEWVCSVARMLEALFTSPQWRPMINSHISQAMVNLQQKVDLSCIFPLFVIAGFPEVLTTGTMVEYDDKCVEKQKGVVLKHFPDKYQTLIINLTTRKRRTIKDQWVSCYTEMSEAWEPCNLDQFVKFFITTVGRIKQGEEMTVELLWALSLALKLLDRRLKSNQESQTGVRDDLMNTEFIQCLVYLACKGTSLNYQWLIRDLEVLSLIWYTSDGKVTKGKKNLKGKKTDSKKKEKSDDEKNDDSDSYYNYSDDDDDDDDDFKSDSDDDDDNLRNISKGKGDNSRDDDDDDDDDAWMSVSSNANDDGDDDDDENNDGDDDTWLSVKVGKNIKELFQMLLKDLGCDPFVLAALYSLTKGNMEEMITEIVNNSEGADKSAVTAIIDKWKGKEKEEKDGGTTTDLTTIDTGVASRTHSITVNKIPDHAEKERCFNMQNLFTNQDKLESAIRKKQRAASAALFKKEVDEHGKSGSRDYLLKINMAMCVLYARHTLTGMLAQWPSNGLAITPTLLGCKDVKQIPCVLDLLHKIDTREFFSKVVNKVIHVCDKSSLIAIAFTAAQFMEEVTLSGVSRESEHNYTDDHTKKGVITIPGASYLTITFDPKCATLDSSPLIFSTRQQLDKDRHSYSGLTRDCWSSFHLPGDTLYFKFDLDEFDCDHNNKHWGYKFTVTAGARDSFETGHAILESVLSSAIARSLPLGKLWHSLVYVCTKQAGHQRVKAIQIMLKILALQHKEDNSDKQHPDIDLGILRPLWELYESFTPDPNDSNVIQPAAVGALTELFLQVEALAEEWDQSKDYLISLINKHHVRTMFMWGLRTVAIVGHQIEWPNIATTAMSGANAAATDKAIRNAIPAGAKKSVASSPVSKPTTDPET